MAHLRVAGLARVDAHVVRGTFPDMLTITKLMQVLTSLEPIQSWRPGLPPA